MKGAIEFLKKYGINDAKQLVSMGSGTCEIDDGISFHTNDLKRLVESHELVGRYGTADEAKEYLPMLRMDSYDELKQAILDVESCQ